MINAKKYRKTIEWERLEISSRKVEIPRDHLIPRTQFKMGTIKDRNGMDLIEAEDIKKRYKNTQNYTKKIFMTR